MTPFERERHLEQWLDSTARRPSGRGPGVCLDAETAASWVAGTLPERVLSATQAHVANCGACQALMQALLETELSEGVGADTPSVDQARHAAVADVRTPGLTWRGWLTWGTPLGAAAAAALALAVWMKAPAPELTAGRDTVAQVEVPKEASPARVPPANAVMPQSAPPAVPRSEPMAPMPQARLAPNTLQAPSGGAEAPKAVPDAVAERFAAKSSDARERADTASVAGLSAAENRAVPPPPPPAPASPAASAASPAPAAAPLREQVAPVAAADARGTLQVGSATGSGRWRVSGSRIERSTDAGRTWLDIGPTGGAQLTAGSAPGNGTCWFVGRGGIVLVFDEQSGLQPAVFPDATDLVSVSARSARDAVVVTADGRRLRTDDGGRSWTREP